MSEMLKQANTLARKVGFSSCLEAPPAVNAMLLHTHPQSPQVDLGLVNFINSCLRQRHRPETINGFAFTSQHIHDFFCDLAVGIRYITKKYQDVKQLGGYRVASSIETEKGTHAEYQAAFTSDGENTTLIVSPNFMISVMFDKIGQDLQKKEHGPKSRTFTYQKLPGQNFTGREIAILAGVEEAFHAHQYFSDEMEAPRHFIEHGAAAYHEDPDEVAAKEVLEQAVKDLGLGSRYATGRRKK